MNSNPATQMALQRFAKLIIFAVISAAITAALGTIVSIGQNDPTFGGLVSTATGIFIMAIIGALEKAWSERNTQPITPAPAPTDQPVTTVEPTPTPSVTPADAIPSAPTTGPPAV